MAKTTTKPKKPTKAEIAQVMKYLSSKGASAGGKARAAKLTPKRRREIARKAIETRWNKAKAKKKT